jgi:hypothetical protein
MQMLWCWRCRAEMPMLDEEEFHRVHQHFRDGKSELVDAPRGDEPAWEHPVMTSATKRMLDEYNRITHFNETNPSAVWHHRISLYGPACHACDKPLRSPRARFCAACGAVRAQSEAPPPNTR